MNNSRFNITLSKSFPVIRDIVVGVLVFIVLYTVFNFITQIK